MKLTFVSLDKSISVKYWSGTEFFIAKYLDENNEIDYITNLKTNRPFLFLKKVYYRLLCGKNYSPQRTSVLGKSFAKEVSKKLLPETQLIFSAGTIPIAYLKTNIPKVIYTDASFASMVGYYDSYSNFCKETIDDASRMEQEAFDSCSLAIFSSDWAAKGAMDQYKIGSEKVKVIPFGANIKNEKSLDEIKEALSKRDRAICKILFIGVDWKRKNGDKVLETVNLMNQQGLKTELHVVGIPQIETRLNRSHLINHGFVSKSKPEGLAQIEGLLLASHLLFVPSLTETYGIVFCEAAAFGLPAIATKTGGVSSIVKDGINGQLFDLDASAQEYANFITDLYTDRERYERLCLSSYNEYKLRLNWRVAGEALNLCLKELLEHKTTNL